MIIGFSVISGFAQSEASTENGRPPQKVDLPKNIQETLDKNRIEKEKKDHEELLEKAQEALKISSELQESFTKNNGLSTDDRKKLDRLEKLLKKIRKELGGDDDGNESVEKVDNVIKEENSPDSVSIVEKLRTTSVNLLDELKKTSRFSISVVAIQSSNLLLKMIRFLRFNK